MARFNQPDSLFLDEGVKKEFTGLILRKIGRLQGEGRLPLDDELEKWSEEDSKAV